MKALPIMAVIVALLTCAAFASSPKGSIEDRVRHLEQKAGGLQSVISQLFRADKDRRAETELLQNQVDNLQTVLCIAITHIQSLEQEVDALKAKKSASVDTAK